MIAFNKIYEVLREGDTDNCYAINVTIDSYSHPITMKTVQWQNTVDGDTTDDVEVIDWDNCTKVGTGSKQILIPADKQTNKYPSARRATNTEYDTLYWEWLDIVEADSDIQKIINDLLAENNEVYITS